MYSFILINTRNDAIIHTGGAIMNRAELLKKLKANGCKIVEHGARHDKVYSPITGQTFPLWRHSKEMKKGTVEAILKQAGIK
jgi:predicted RNA binding protein YcfA (HicA-like mRNA interferase family)